MIYNHPTLTKILADMLDSGKINLDSLNEKQKKAVYDIISCHTELCGFTKEVCEHCGKEIIHYGSCNNPACGQCGKKKRDEWIEKQQEKKVNAPYFHIVFTVPDQHLNPLFLYDPAFMYNALFKATSRVLKNFSADPKFLGITKIGYTAMLHTFGATMNLHCHIHVVFPAVGLDQNGNLVVGKDDFLFPAKTVAKSFKGEFLKIVKKKYDKPNSPWNKKLNRAGKEEWNVQIQSCKGDPDHVILYLSRYVNRTAISNGRLVSHQDGKVKFKYKNYRNNSKISEMVLTEEEFFRRLMLHILPRRFVKCRRFGFLSGNQGETLKKIQNLTHTGSSSQPIDQNENQNIADDLDLWNEDITDSEFLALPEENDKHVCRYCGSDQLVVVGKKLRTTNYAEKRFLILHKAEKMKKFLLSG